MRKNYSWIRELFIIDSRKRVEASQKFVENSLDPCTFNEKSQSPKANKSKNAAGKEWRLLLTRVECPGQGNDLPPH